MQFELINYFIAFLGFILMYPVLHEFLKTKFFGKQTEK